MGLGAVSGGHGQQGADVCRGLADRIGSSREMVNRVMKELTAGGYVAVRDGRHVILRKLPANW